MSSRWEIMRRVGDELGSEENQRMAVVRAMVERLVEELRRPDPNLDLARSLANVALNDLRKLEQS